MTLGSGAVLSFEQTSWMEGLVNGIGWSTSEIATMSGWFVLTLLFLSTRLMAPRLPDQVQLGTSNPNFCNKVEHVTPNLSLRQRAHISGSLVDDSGAPLQRMRVELRLYVSAQRQSPVRSVRTDDQGRFDVGKIEAGQYRMLAPATRVYAQPQMLTCSREECQFSIQLHVNPSDLPISSCPVR